MTIVVIVFTFIFIVAIACRCHLVHDVTAYDSGRVSASREIKQNSPVLLLHVGGVVWAAQLIAVVPDEYVMLGRLGKPITDTCVASRNM